MAPRGRPSAAARAAAARLAPHTLILDNGAYTIKAGLAGHASPSPSSCAAVPNAIAHSARDRRTYIGSQLDECEDFGELSFKRPVQKGYVVRWEEERRVWEREFLDAGAGIRVEPKETNLILTEAPNAIPSLQAMTDQMVFEYFEFASCYRSIGPALNAYNNIASLFESAGTNTPPPSAPPECLLIIDSGYSHTTVTPLLNGRPLQSAIRRVSIGGKHITNFLKEAASIRHFNVMDETALLNDAKEAVCFVSEDFPRDLERAWKGGVRDRKKVDHSLVIDYVLPDYENIKQGIVRPHDPAAHSKLKRLALGPGPKEDVLPLANERFRAPELLFRPTDIGLQEVGVQGAVIESLTCLPEGLKPGMLANIVVVGGNSLIPGFMMRLESEIRQLIPSEFPLRIVRPPDPIKYTWLGGAHLAASSSTLSKLVVTRAEYHEMGPNRLPLRYGYGVDNAP